MDAQFYNDTQQPIPDDRSYTNTKRGFTNTQKVKLQAPVKLKSLEDIKIVGAFTRKYKQFKVTGNFTPNTCIVVDYIDDVLADNLAKAEPLIFNPMKDEEYDHWDRRMTAFLDQRVRANERSRARDFLAVAQHLGAKRLPDTASFESIMAKLSQFTEPLPC